MPRKPIDGEFICDRLCSWQIAPEGTTAAAARQGRLPVLPDYHIYRGSLSIGTWNKLSPKNHYDFRSRTEYGFGLDDGIQTWYN